MMWAAGRWSFPRGRATVKVLPCLSGDSSLLWDSTINFPPCSFTSSWKTVSCYHILGNMRTFVSDRPIPVPSWLRLVACIFVQRYYKIKTDFVRTSTLWNLSNTFSISKMKVKTWIYGGRGKGTNLTLEFRHLYLWHGSMHDLGRKWESLWSSRTLYLSKVLELGAVRVDEIYSHIWKHFRLGWIWSFPKNCDAMRGFFTARDWMNILGIDIRQLPVIEVAVDNVLFKCRKDFGCWLESLDHKPRYYSSRWHWMDDSWV